MKKKIILLLSSTALLLTACGAENTVVESETSETVAVEIEQTEQEETSEDAGLSVDENLLTVDITIPKDMASGDDDSTQEYYDSVAAEAGYQKATLNEDGSVTYRMSKSKHKEILENLKNGVEDICNDFVVGEDAVESFDKIEFTDDMDKFTVYVDASLYNNFDAIQALTLYVSGSYYQLFSGVPNDQIDVQVDFVDKDTNEVLNSGKLSDTQDSAEE